MSNNQKSNFSNFIETLSTRFSKLDNQVFILFLDTDETKDSHNSRSGDLKSFSKKLDDKLKGGGRDFYFKPVEDTVNDIYYSVIEGSFPNTYTKDLKEEKRTCIVISGNPDSDIKTRIAKLSEGLEVFPNRDITREEFQKFIIYHEIAHCLDSELGKESAAGHTDNYKRLQEETLADTFAVLQLAKDEGNNNFSKFFAESRLLMMANDVKPLAFDKKSVVLTYYTNPAIEAAIKFAEKSIADGSLFKLSDKEIFERSKEIADNNIPAPSVIRNIESGFKGDKNPDYLQYQAKVLSAEKRNNKNKSNSDVDFSNLWLGEKNFEIAKLPLEDNSEIKSFINKERNLLRQEKSWQGAEEVVSVIEGLTNYPSYIIESANNYLLAGKEIDKALPYEFNKSKLEDEFLKHYALALQNGKSAADFESVNSANCFKELLSHEKTMMEIAKHIDLNKLEKGSVLTELVRAKKKGVYPVWVGAINFAVKTKDKFFETKITLKQIEKDEKIYDYGVKEYQNNNNKNIKPEIRKIPIKHER